MLKLKIVAALLGKIGFFALAVATAAAPTQDSQLFDPNTAPAYEKVVAAEPPGLTLAVTLPKDHFYQGEIIDATLTYTNTGTGSYTATLAKMDRSGRVQDVHFFAVDEHRVPVEDPIGWIYHQGYMGGGRVERAALGTGSITLTMNQWLRFDHPGTYSVFAVSTAVSSDKVGAAPNTDNRVQLVSNKLTVIITALPADQEQRIIAEALAKIIIGYDRHDDPKLTGAANEDNARRNAYAARPAIETLRYLQTPAARAALRSRLDKTPEYMLAGGHFEMVAALLGAPDRPAEAALILADVQAGRLKIDGSLIGLYAQLKSYPQFIEYTEWERHAMTPAEIPQWRAVNAAWEKSQKDAQKEILAAATEVAAKNGLSVLDLIWMAFQNNPFDPDYRSPVVAHQLDFDHQRQVRLLWMVVDYFCNRMALSQKPIASDFMPLVRLYLGPPAYNHNALIILSYVRPQEAHDITVADWASPVHHYFNNEHGDDDAPLGKLAVTLLENPQIKWTDEQKEILDHMRRPN